MSTALPPWPMGLAAISWAIVQKAMGRPVWSPALLGLRDKYGGGELRVGDRFALPPPGKAGVVRRL